MSEAWDNENKLVHCVGPHRFARSPVYLRVEWICEKCGGAVTDDQYRWYCRGLAHGAQDDRILQAARKLVPIAGKAKKVGTTCCKHGTPTDEICGECK